MDINSTAEIWKFFSQYDIHGKIKRKLDANVDLRSFHSGSNENLQGEPYRTNTTFIELCFF